MRKKASMRDGCDSGSKSVAAKKEEKADNDSRKDSKTSGKEEKKLNNIKIRSRGESL